MMNIKKLLLVFIGALTLSQNEVFSASSSLGNTDPDNVRSVTSRKITHEILFEDDSADSNREVMHRAWAIVSNRLLENQHRQLGDFDAFNALFNGTVIILPDALNLEAGRYLWYDVYIDLTEIRCKNLAVNDILISHEQLSKQKLDVRIQLLGVKMICNMTVGYRMQGLGGRSGNGIAEAETQNSSADTIIEFISDNFDNHPPKESKLGPCEANVELGEFSFGGEDFFFTIANLFKSLFKSTIEGEIEQILCSELGSFGAESLDELLKLLNNRIVNYTEPLPPHLEDPLHVEKNLAPSNVTLVNLQNPNTTIIKWFTESIDLISSYLGNRQPDASGPTGTGDDLGVNILMRSYLLDDNREYVIPFSDWPIGDNNGSIFNVHDRLTQTSMYLGNAKIIGLDTMTHIDPFNIVGKYTMKNHFSWKQLILEADIKLNITASTLPDSMFESSNGEELVENIKVTIGLDDIDIDFHFLLALDEDKVKNLHLSQVLNSTRVISCLLDTVHKGEITGLSLNATNIHKPTLSGFISNGMDRIITNLVNAFFDMYEIALKKAMPNFFQTEIRGILNNATSNLVQDQSTDECVPWNKTGDFKAVDFRDLLLEPDEAKVRGAIGDGRYGDIVYILKGIIEDELLANDPESTVEEPLANRVVIRPFTKSQSGVEGALRFNDTIGIVQENITDPIGSAIADRVYFRASDFQLSNLDTLHHPIEILDPLNKSTTLFNQLNLGERQTNSSRKLLNIFNNPLQASSQHLIGSARVLLAVEGDGSPFEMRNEINLSIIVPHAEVIAAFLVLLSEDNFMTMKLDNILNINCWLAMIQGPQLDDDGFPIGNSTDPNIKVDQLLLALSDLQLQMDCISCSSTIQKKLPEVFEVINDSGATYELRKRIISFATEVVLGPWSLTLISRELFQAPKQCPGNPLYIENYNPPNYNTSAFPLISDESMETAILFGAILSEVALVLVAESHSNIKQNNSDPVSAQKNFVVPPNITIVDFENMNSTFGSLADAAISQIRSIATNVIDDIKGPKAPEKDLEINVQLRSLLLDENRTFAIDVDGLSFSFGGATVELNKIRLNGLDTFKSVDILDIIAPQTVLNKLLLEKLTMEVDIIIDTIGTERGPEVMTIKLGLRDVNVTVGTFMAFDEEALGKIELGSVLHIKNILPCLISTLYRFEMTQLDISVSDIDIPTFEGYISATTNETISSSMELVFRNYKQLMIDSMPAFFHVTMRKFFNRLIQNYIDDPNTFCPSAPLTSRFFMNFGDLLLSEEMSLGVNGLGTSPYGEVMRMLMDLINETILKINPNDGTSAINEQLIRSLTKAQSNIPGTLILYGDVFGTRSELDIGGLQGVLEFKASDAKIENLDTAGQPLKILDPIGPHVLNNTATFGVGPRELRAAVSLLIAFKDDNHFLRNEFDMSLDVKSAQVVVATLIKMTEKIFLKFPMRDIFNIHCWLATIPAPPLDNQGVRLPNSELNAAIQNLAVAMSKIRLHINCTDCSSPGMHTFASHLSTTDAVNSVTDVANDLFGYFTSLMSGKFLQIQIDRFLNEAPAKCPHNPKYDASASAAVYEPFSSPKKTSDPLGFLFAILGVCLSLLCIVVLLIISVRRIRQRRHKLWIATLSKEEILQLIRQQTLEKNREDRLNSTTTRMVSSPVIPTLVRYMMPIVILGNVGLFLSGHINLGASVNIMANIAGDTININNFFEFSMAKSTLDMWNAGAKTLAVFVGLFSGAWPYTKQFITLFLWIAHPKLISVSRRESVFLWLDKLAKWSIVDIFVLLMSVAAFNLSVNSPRNVAFLPQNLYSFKLYVVPLWGMYANMTAQFLSQVSSHFIIHYHRKIVTEALGETGESSIRLGIDDRNESMETNNTDLFEEIKSTPEENKIQQNSIGALCNHRFDRDGIKKNISLHIHSWVNYVVAFLAVCFTVMLICGCVITSFSLEIVGIIGLIVESGQEFNQAITRYAVFDFVKALANQSNFLGSAADGIGLGTLSFLLILSVFIVPILQMVLFTIRWFSPLTRKSQIRLFVTLEILDAWQYIEVYILSVSVASWQLGNVSEYMINSFCGSLEDVFSSLAYYNIISDEDAQCFRVNPRVQSGFWLLLTSALLLSFMNHFVRKAASQQERDIIRQMEEHKHELSERQGRNLYNPSDDCDSSENSVSGAEDFVDGETNKNLKQTVTPPKLHFTDYYRWFLRREVISKGYLVEEGGVVPIEDNEKPIADTTEISSNA